jgi:hypothetical protein
MIAGMTSRAAATLKKTKIARTTREQCLRPPRSSWQLQRRGAQRLHSLLCAHIVLTPYTPGEPISSTDSLSRTNSELMMATPRSNRRNYSCPRPLVSGREPALGAAW